MFGRALFASLLLTATAPAQDLSTAGMTVEPVEIGPYAEKIVWPTSGTTEPGFGISGTFGPRQQGAEGFRHDFHRAIDIRCPRGTPIHAIADGEVRIAGKHEAYETQLVQIKHFKPERGESCRDGGCYYSNSMHLADVTVKVGDMVKAGDVIGHSGSSKTEDELLHFEIRDGGVYSRHCVHPLAVLPYDNASAPTINIDTVSATKSGTLVAVTATCPQEELDLGRVEVAVFDGAKELGRRTYDLHEWNRAFTPQGEGGTKILDQPLVNHVRAEPGRYTLGQERYELTLVFDDLPPIADKRRLVVKAKAIDVRGKASAEAERKGAL